MTSTKVKQEGFYKVFISLQFLCVVGLGFLFYYTCTRIDPPDMPASTSPNSLDMSEAYTTDKVMSDIADMKPSQDLAGGNQQQAVAEATQMAAQRPYDVESLMCAGNVLTHSQDKDKEGFRLLRRSVTLAPNSRWVRLNYAHQLYLAKRYEEAIPQYELLFQGANTQWTDPHYELAQLYMDQKQFDKAVEQLQAAVQFDSKRGLTFKQMALATACGAQEGQDNDGFAEFKKGVTLEDNSERAALQHCPGEVEPLVVQTDKNPKKALEQVREQLKASPKDSDLKLEEARLLIACNQLDDAKTVLAALEKDEKDDADVYETKAQLLLMQGDEAGAKDAFAQAVKLTKEGT